MNFNIERHDDIHSVQALLAVYKYNVDKFRATIM